MFLLLLFVVPAVPVSLVVCAVVTGEGTIMSNYCSVSMLRDN